ncbi:threonine synthase [Haloimpatiens sp. FM7330]|uniref:threonine synthase n=1 Tax=Haloimpatiens sp. FM7330 TaxID=3298610 RepID=UPI003640ECA9
MELMYKSTRDQGDFITSSEAIIKGLSDYGGLFVPTNIPKIHKEIDKLIDFNYKELALYILKKFLTDFKEKDLIDCIEKAYDDKFDTEEIAPVCKKGENFFLELYHGPTLAFKDMALSILPHLLKSALKKNKITKEVVILTATSGDTGKAALEGFANVEGIKIIVFFPKEGVSDIQKRQMITQKGDNTYVIGIEGNFDDAQNAVKEIFNNEVYNQLLNKNNYILSSANSINIGRLIPQIVYYFYAYLKMIKSKSIKKGEKINVVVPTGNFGNILAAYYAKEMGFPINKLICASNENNVLYDFIKTGIYDKNRSFKITSSPSMDILISSNLERLLYYISGKNEEVVLDLMNDLKVDGKYEIGDNMRIKMKDFYGGFASQLQTSNCIKEVYDNFKYVIDPHTAVAYSVYKTYKNETKDITKTVIVSTASPFKFTNSVCSSIGINVEGKDDFQLIDELSKECEINIPKGIEDLKNRKVFHKDICKKEEIKDAINRFLKV